MAEFRAQKSREMEPLPTALKAWIAEGVVSASVVVGMTGAFAAAAASEEFLFE
jgi:hypothetical protein